MNAYWPTLGKYVEGLEKAGKLVRITIPVNKDTELHPLVRLQFRGLPESQRKAFLFENVVDGSGRRYDIPVLVGALAGSADIYALGHGLRSRRRSRRSGATRSPIRSPRSWSATRPARRW